MACVQVRRALLSGLLGGVGPGEDSSGGAELWLCQWTKEVQKGAGVEFKPSLGCLPEEKPTLRNTPLEGGRFGGVKECSS